MSTLARGRELLRTKAARPLIYLLLYIAAVALVNGVLPINTSCNGQSGPQYLGIDYLCVFRPAVINLLHFQTPYTGLYYNPPWILLVLAPLALLSPSLGASALAVISLLAFAVAFAVLRRRSAEAPRWITRVAMAFLILNPFLWTVARQGNLDWLVALGAVLPPQIGLFLVFTKPQAGIAIGIFWGVQALREGGIWKAVRVFAPVTAAYLLSFLLFGLWVIPPHWVVVHPMNYSLWPLSLPIGLALLASALRRANVRRAITASPFLAPYVLTMTWAVAFLGLEDWELIAAVIGSWILLALQPNLGTYPLKLTP